jgi:hypothetical protein
MGESRLKAKVGRTLADDTDRAADEILSAVRQREMAVVLFFCSPKYDRKRLAERLSASLFCPVLGCTSAGEISPEGYQKGGMVAASLSSLELKVHVRRLSPLCRVDGATCRGLAEDLRKKLVLSRRFDRSRMFGLVLIDGLSRREDEVIAALAPSFEGVPIFGGSAGDDLAFRETQVYAEGKFLPDSAAFALFETTLPFDVFKTQHFVPTGTKVVVTGAEPERRIINEINGEPAAEEYARSLGLGLGALDSAVFSANPLMIRIGGDYYVRSIQKVTAERGLSLYSSIEEGLVLTIGKGADIASDLQEKIAAVRKVPSANDFGIFCDCILRRQELADRGLLSGFHNHFGDLKFVGFSTYGEQCDGIHVNQTLTGVIIHGG